MAADRLGEMRGQDRGGIHDGVAEALGALPVGDADPRRRQAEDGLGRGDTADGDLAAVGIHAQHLGWIDRAP